MDLFLEKIKVKIKQMKNNKQIFVLGYERTGSSMISGVLHRLGVHMGQNLSRATSDYQHGLYEDSDFKYLADKIVTSFYCRIFFHKASYIENYHLLENIAKKHTSTFKYLIKQRDQNYAVWGCKETTMALFLQIFEPYLTNPYWLITKRNTDENILSSLHKFPLNIPKKRLLKNQLKEISTSQIKSYLMNKTRNILHVLKFRKEISPEWFKQNMEFRYERINQCLANKNTYTIDYNQFITSPYDSIQSLIDYLQLSPTSIQIDQALVFIKPELNHKGKQ